MVHHQIMQHYFCFAPASAIKVIRKKTLILFKYSKSNKKLRSLRAFLFLLFVFKSGCEILFEHLHPAPAYPPVSKHPAPALPVIQQLMLESILLLRLVE